MKVPPLVLRCAPACLVLALLLLPSSARAEDAAKAKETHDENLQKVLAKYDANHNGQLDEVEKAKMKADEDAARAAQAEKYKQALAKYDANHNGKLDPEELAKMKEDELLAAKTERQADRADERLHRKIDRAEGNKATRVRRH